MILSFLGVYSKDLIFPTLVGFGLLDKREGFALMYILTAKVLGATLDACFNLVQGFLCICKELSPTSWHEMEISFFPTSIPLISLCNQNVNFYFVSGFCISCFILNKPGCRIQLHILFPQRIPSYKHGDVGIHSRHGTPQ